MPLIKDPPQERQADADSRRDSGMTTYTITSQSNNLESEQINSRLSPLYHGPNRSTSLTTSAISYTGRRDYGMKFDAGIEEMASGPTTVVPQSVVTQPPQPEEIEDFPSRPPPPPTYGDQTHSRYRRDRRYVQEEDRSIYDDEDWDNGGEPCHPYWMGWWNIIMGIYLIVVGTLKIPLVMLHGLSKFFYNIPVLYKDESVRPWPKITGIGTGLVAGVQDCFFGLFYGVTDWFVLPVKEARKYGFTGIFTGFARGLGNIVFKPLSGLIAFVGHPLFGIYKEVSKIKIIVRRERRSKRKLESPV